MRVLLNNIRDSFTNMIKKIRFGETSICIIVAYEVDSVCALKIFTSLLNKENLQFKVKPVLGYQDMVRAIEEQDTYPILIFINCGAIYNMSDYRKKGVRFYIFDNHQPVNPSNINAKKGIFIIDDGQGVMHKCPEDEYQEVSEMEEEEDLSDAELKQQFNQRQEYKRRQMMINQKYEEYNNIGHFYTRPTSCVIYILACQMNHDCNDLLWLAILGLTDAYINQRITQKLYDLLYTDLFNEVLKLNPEVLTQTPEDLETHNKRVGMIFQEQEYKFMLLRQQSLFNAMYYSNYVGTKLKLWRDKENNNKLQDFLAVIGIPFQDAMQEYRYMDAKSKKLLKSKLSEVSQKFQMEDIIYRSFVRQTESKIQVSATEMVYSIAAMLDFPTNLLSKYTDQYQCSETIKKLQGTNERAINFWSAYDTLEYKSQDLFEQGVQMAIEYQHALVNEANLMLEKKEIFPAKFFRYGVLKSDTPQQKRFFTHPQALQKLALLIMEIYKEQGYGSQSNSKSVILSALNGESYVVVGVVGTQNLATSEKNQFGNNFLRVVHEFQISYRQDSFETSVIEIHKEDFITFLNSMLSQR